MSKLREIFEWKRLEVEETKISMPLGEIEAMVRVAPTVRPFRKALASSPHPLALIAEVKKASPSRGLIRESFDPSEIGKAYAEAGADCLSVLTDERYFQGNWINLPLARDTSGLPCLRKDFIFDPYQVVEARAFGADCILLIVAGIEAGLLAELSSLAKDLGMDVLVEVHSMPEAEVAMKTGANLIGVNNRNLADMTTSIPISEEVLPALPSDVLKVSESALESRDDLERVAAAGARAVLIGTTFCASPNIRARVREVMGW